MHHLNLERGIVVFTGPMFSEKTSELIRHLNRYRIAKVKSVVFRPERDDRKERSIEGAIKVASAAEIPKHVDDDVQVVAIDEAQFFDESLIELVDLLALQKGKLVMLAALDLDFRGRPFGIVPQLLAIATHVEKLTAICTICGKQAHRSQRITKSTELVVTGSAESYEARCLEHFSRAPKDMPHLPDCGLHLSEETGAVMHACNCR